MPVRGDRIFAVERNMHNEPTFLLEKLENNMYQYNKACTKKTGLVGEPKTAQRKKNQPNQTRSNYAWVSTP